MDLIQKVALLTQLPPEQVTTELYRIAGKYQMELDSLDLEDLRFIMNEYVKEVLKDFDSSEALDASLS